MARSTSIKIDERIGARVDAQVSAGRYESASDVLDDALRLLEEEQTRLDALRLALKEGEESGRPAPFDFEAFLAGKSL